jgi:hypothetical protein
MTLLGTSLEEVHAKPNEYQVIACQNLLKGLLSRPETLLVSRTELISQEVDEEDKGSAIIYFAAQDRYGKEVESTAFCSAEDRASASIMDIRHVDHMRF